MSHSVMPTQGTGNVVSREGTADMGPLPGVVARRRRRRMLEGVITEVTFVPAHHHPNFNAVLKVNGGQLPEGTYVRLRWNGQRMVPGVRAGTRMRCDSLVCDATGEPTMYNPRYEIISSARSVQR